MAKGLRSSVKKSNRTKLRARVFEPVENARLERIHQKLLETAQQPKPETAKDKEMDVDSAEGTKSPLPPPTPHPLTHRPADAAAADDTTKEENLPKGSFLLTASIPQSLHSATTAQSSTTDKPTPAHDDPESRTLYDLLGLCSDVVGFTPSGHLEFAFDPLPPQWLSHQGLTVS